MMDSATHPTRTTRGIALSRRPFALMLRAGFRASVFVLPVAAVIFWLTRGAEGAWSSALGSVIALAFFAGGLLLMDKMVG